MSDIILHFSKGILFGVCHLLRLTTKQYEDTRNIVGAYLHLLINTFNKIWLELKVTNQNIYAWSI